MHELLEDVCKCPNGSMRRVMLFGYGYLINLIDAIPFYGAEGYSNSNEKGGRHWRLLLTEELNRM